MRPAVRSGRWDGVLFRVRFVRGLWDGAGAERGTGFPAGHVEPLHRPRRRLLRADARRLQTEAPVLEPARLAADRMQERQSLHQPFGAAGIGQVNLRRLALRTFGRRTHGVYLEARERIHRSSVVLSRGGPKGPFRPKSDSIPAPSERAESPSTTAAARPWRYPSRSACGSPAAASAEPSPKTPSSGTSTPRSEPRAARRVGPGSESHRPAISRPARSRSAGIPEWMETRHPPPKAVAAHRFEVATLTGLGRESPDGRRRDVGEIASRLAGTSRRHEFTELDGPSGDKSQFHDSFMGRAVHPTRGWDGRPAGRYLPDSYMKKSRGLRMNGFIGNTSVPGICEPGVPG